MQKKLFSNEKGQVLIFVTLAFVLLGMFIGLAVDGGRAYLMRERLRSIVDAAALAGAKAMAGPADPTEAEEAARKAACDSALVNGVDAGDCSSGKFTVAVSLNPERKVTVTGSAESRTFFMALGGFIGCESCKRIDLQHVGTAVPDTLADVVLVLDDTGTMSSGCITFTEPNCPIRGAKEGAKNLIDMLFADAQSHARIAYVPFRGCYSPFGSTDRLLPDLIKQAYQTNGIPPDEIARRGCILRSEMMDLTEPADKDALKAQIDSRRGSPGFPGTNICVAMLEGRAKLFGNGNRAIARKIMIILSDGANNYSDSADGPQQTIPHLPNLGLPIPTPYPAHKYLAGNRPAVPNIGDEGTDSNPSCMSNTSPGDDFVRWAPNFNQAIADLDIKTNNYASVLKNADPSGTNVEIYFLRFANPPGDTLMTGVPEPGACDPTLVGNLGPPVIRFGSNNNYDPSLTNDIRDRNLSRCLASNTAMADPRSQSANDHYFYAANAQDITAKFQQIASNILQKRRLVS